MYGVSLGIFNVHVKQPQHTSFCICLPNFVRIGPSAA